MVKNESLIEYMDKIKDLTIDKVVCNQFNPREKFVESEEDELIDSIMSKGILNPVIVFKRKSDGKYILLDGERRFRACQKLNITTIPAHVLVREPTNLENLSMMFHIHNVREEWTDFAISISIKKVVDNMGKDVRKLIGEDIKELKRLTSLSEYRLRKYLKFQDYPKEVITRFLESETKEKQDKGVDPDILAEMHRPIKQIKSQMPELLNDYPVKKIIDACIKKKANNIIETNKEFRLLSKSLAASKRGEIRKEVMKDKIVQFIEKLDVSPKDIYKTTSEILYRVKDLVKTSENLYEDLNNLNVQKLTSEEKKELKDKFTNLVRLINEKIL